MSRRVVAAALVGLWSAGVALAGAPVAGGTSPSGPAADDVPVNLTPLDRSADGPTPVRTGRYYDTFADEQQSYRFERTVPESTVFFGLTLLDSDAELRTRSVIVVATPDGHRCGRSAPDPGYVSDLWSVTQAAGTDGTATCLGADRLDLTVRRPERAEPGVPFELAVYELPPAANPKALGPGTGDLDDRLEVEDPERSLKPGATRPEASVLPGSEPVHVDLTAGEQAWFAITDVPTARWVVAHASATDPTGSFQGGRLEIRLVSPVGGLGSVHSEEISQSDPADSVASIGRQPVLVEAHSWWLSSAPIVDDAGYPATSFGVGDRLSALPGTWYVLLRASGTGDGPLSVTLTGRVLRHDENSTYTPDQTEYVEPPPTLPDPVGAKPKRWTAPATTPTPTPSPSPEPEAAADDAGADDPSTPWPAVTMLFGAAAVLTALGALAWRRR